MSYSTGYQGNFNPNQAATIAASSALSGVVPCGGFVLCGIAMPAAFTGTSISFEACNTSSGTFLPVYNASGLVSYSVSASEYIAINPQDFYGVNYLIIKSNATEAAQRSLVLSMKGF